MLDFSITEVCTNNPSGETLRGDIRSEQMKNMLLFSILHVNDIHLLASIEDDPGNFIDLHRGRDLPHRQ